MTLIKLFAASVLMSLAALTGCGGGNGDVGPVPAPAPSVLAPTLTTQPQSQTVQANSSASFVVQATGDAPLSFQWQRNGQDIGAAVAATLTLPAAQIADDAASFSVRVSNPGGTVVSQAAVLTVLLVPTTLSLLAGDLAFVNNPGLGTSSTARDGAGADARFVGIVGLAVDGAGTVYVAEELTVRKVDKQGVVSTLAGGAQGYVDGAGTVARFGGLRAIAVDKAGNVYVSDSGNTAIRKITSTGLVTTIAGGPGKSGHADGPVSSALIASPGSVAVDAVGTVYFVDGPGYRNPPNISQRIRKIDTAGTLNTVAGGEITDFSRSGHLAVDGAGNLYLTGSNEAVSVCVQANCFYNVVSAFIRKITPAGVVSVLAGSAEATGYPTSIAIDALGNLFVADAPRHVVRRLSGSGAVSILAGSTPVGSQPSLPPPFGLQPVINVAPGPLPGGLKNPTLVAVGMDGSVYTTSSPYGDSSPAYVVLKAGVP